MYQDLGVKVTLLEYLPSLVPLEDLEVSQALERTFTRRGRTVMTNARSDPKQVKVTKSGVSLSVGPEGKEAAGSPPSSSSSRPAERRTSRTSGSSRPRPRSTRAS